MTTLTLTEAMVREILERELEQVIVAKAAAAYRAVRVPDEKLRCSPAGLAYAELRRKLGL